jgi:hypothetical protein
VEYWNDGIMGSGKMGYWFIGHFLLDTQIANIQK